ncbi:DNA internalization-related competence protein ComEC/Rec2 [Porticoccaceae bacterium]|nr:DNA internalization-related competence protein ComEC/Rec2 [Porticoccaceae bacterium]
MFHSPLTPLFDWSAVELHFFAASQRYSASQGWDCISVTDICIEGSIVANLIILSVGIFSVAWWPWLPSFSLSVAAFVSLLPLWSLPRLRGLLFLCAGMLWGIFSAQQLLRNTLPEAVNGDEFLISGHIVGLVENNSLRSRFSFNIDSIQAQRDSSYQVTAGRVLLSWYGKDGLEAGQRWQFVVRLRRPRGFVNPRAFDYQAWLLQQGYMATGYVRSPNLAQLQNDSSGASVGYIASLPAQLRSSLRTAINNADLSSRGRAVLLALSIGDKRRLGDWWQDLARLGIVHLLVISGLHIGLVALLGTAVGKGLARLAILLNAAARRLRFNLPSLTLHWLGPVSGLLAAFAYSLLAGFSLPTQRALIAVAVVVIARLCWRRIQPLVCLSWAVTLIALLQPLAVLSGGFWLSFSAVAILIGWFSPWQSIDRWWRHKRALSAQLTLLLMMSVPLLFFIGRLSWFAPLVNVIAIPWVSMVSVPSVLLGCLLLPVSFDMAEGLWQISDWSVGVLWRLLALLPSDYGFAVSPVGTSQLTLLAALFAGLCLMLPHQRLEKWLGVLPLVLLLAGGRTSPGLRVTVLDVGQGLAVVVETEMHTLLYDSGAQYSQAFSAGSGIIAPFFWHRGWSAIDMTLISHEDGDHSGGFESLNQVLPSGRVLTGPAVAYPQTILAGQNAEICRAGRHWRWDDVLFEVLAPGADDQVGNAGNNSSCVVQIRWRDITILLPGDIESAAEYQLLDSERLTAAPIDLLLAPHHGSKTSSSYAFVKHLMPKHVVFSAGYQHQYGHPHDIVEARYSDISSMLWNTAQQGAVTFQWSPSGQLQISAARRDAKRWWR